MAFSILISGQSVAFEQKYIVQLDYKYDRNYVFFIDFLLKITKKIILALKEGVFEWKNNRYG